MLDFYIKWVYSIDVTFFSCPRAACEVVMRRYQRIAPRREEFNYVVHNATVAFTKLAVVLVGGAAFFFFAYANCKAFGLL